METISEVHKEEIKKIFFYAYGPLDEPKSWAELWDRKQAIEYVEQFLKQAGVEGRPFNSYRVEIHKDDGNVQIRSWGESSPSVQFDDYGGQKGLLIELNGEEVFNNLEEINEDEEDE